jgi:hypothetical protein
LEKIRSEYGKICTNFYINDEDRNKALSLQERFLFFPYLYCVSQNLEETAADSIKDLLLIMKNIIPIGYKIEIGKQNKSPLN